MRWFFSHGQWIKRSEVSPIGRRSKESGDLSEPLSQKFQQTTTTSTFPPQPSPPQTTTTSTSQPQPTFPFYLSVYPRPYEHLSVNPRMMSQPPGMTMPTYASFDTQGSHFPNVMGMGDEQRRSFGCKRLPIRPFFNHSHTPPIFGETLSSGLARMSPRHSLQT